MMSELPDLRRLGVILFGVLILVIGLLKLPLQVDPDTYVRSRTVLLRSEIGSCTGTLIISPFNHKPYVLTAGHCIGLLDMDKTVLAANEAGETSRLSFIKVSISDDLMLLTAYSPKGLLVANTVTAHQHLRAITWGDGAPPYVMSGEVLRPDFIFIYPPFFTKRLLTNVHIVPGSSGGPFVDDNNYLAGIVLMTAPSTLFSNGATPEVIRDFLKGVE